MHCVDFSNIKFNRLFLLQKPRKLASLENETIVRRGRELLKIPISQTYGARHRTSGNKLVLTKSAKDLIDQHILCYIQINSKVLGRVLPIYMILNYVYIIYCLIYLESCLEDLLEDDPFSSSHNTFRFSEKRQILYTFKQLLMLKQFK